MVKGREVDKAFYCTLYHFDIQVYLMLLVAMGR